MDYRRPDQLPEGGVLVVGASATGVQLAEEIHRSGRPVTLSVGEHVRLPRTYRGRDILWWMSESGVWDERYDQIDDLDRARGLPSPQLVGKPDRSTLDLNVLSRLASSWWAGGQGARRKALFSGGLRNQFTLADLKMNRLLDTFDTWARENGRMPKWRRPNGSSPRECRKRNWISTSRVVKSVPFSGRPVSVRTIAGSTRPCSIAKGACVTMAELSTRLASM